MLKALGDRAVLQPPADKVAAAMATPAPEEGDEEAPAPHQPERQRAKPKRGGAAPLAPGVPMVASPAAPAAAAAAAAAGAAGEVVKFGSRINNAAIRVWWPGDRTFYPARVTSYKQGCVAGWLQLQC